MTLANHALAGAASALIFRKNPLLAFFAAFLSHFVLDAVPHWHYKLKSFKKLTSDPLEGKFIFDRRFLTDLLRLGIDFGLGAGTALAATKILWPNHFSTSFIGIIGGVLPDVLQFVYYLFPDSILKELQKFHNKIHYKKDLNNYPLLGISLQIISGILLLIAIRMI